MVNLSNSHSLTEFQRNARAFIGGMIEIIEPMLVTVNCQLQALIIDPVNYQQMEKEMERQRPIAALREGDSGGPDAARDRGVRRDEGAVWLLGSKSPI